MLGINIHKNIKLFYYTKNAILQLIPRWFFRNRLSDMMRPKAEDDIDYLNKRVDYYNRLHTASTLPKKVKSLKELKRGKKNTTYFFDSYEVTRYFNPRLLVKFEFGDITQVPQIPSIVKSRPIYSNNEKSVLLKLNKVRHFIFVRDKNRFENKKNMLIGRGGVSDRKPKRIAFYKKYFDHPLCDLGQTNRNSKFHLWYKKKISIEKHLKYKFILCLEGIDVSSNLKWVMSSSSIAVMAKPQFETWFMEGQLIPDFHYIQIRDDYSDLEKKLTYFIDNPDKCMNIIQNANAYVEQFKNKRREKLISLMVLEKYFIETRQSL